MMNRTWGSPWPFFFFNLFGFLYCSNSSRSERMKWSQQFHIRKLRKSLIKKGGRREDKEEEEKMPLITISTVLGASVFYKIAQAIRIIINLIK